MKKIDYDEIVRNITAELEAKKLAVEKLSFDDVKLSKAQYNNYSLKYDSIDFGKGLKKIINKLANKVFKRTGFMLTQDQNEINHTFIGKIEELYSRVQYLENKIQILEEKNK